MTTLVKYKQDDNEGNHIMDGLLGEGVGLMLLGMGSVFLFLVVLIFATMTMSLLINRFFPDEPVVAASFSNPVAEVTNKSGVDAKMVAVVTAAIHQHRNNTNSK